MQDEIGNYVTWSLNHFSLVMVAIALIFICAHKLINNQVYTAEIFYRWLALFGLGFTCVFAFIMHGFYPAYSAAVIGWHTSPFQFEVAMADLAIGVLGMLSFRASHGFRLATVIAASIALWGDATGHLYQLYVYNNFSLSNAGSWFWMDILVPLILIICLAKTDRD